MDDKRWERQAACAPENRPKAIEKLDWFTTDKEEKYQARAVCQGQCLVRRQCLETALARRELHGIWGGVDDYELRRAMSVDSNGDATQRNRTPRCPYCLGRKLLVSGQKTKGRGYMTRCQNEECGLEWYMATVPQKLKGKKVA